MSKIAKFRRIALTMLFAVALFALIFALAGCSSSSSAEAECTHKHTTTTTDATCTEAGTRTVTCDDCGAVLSSVTVPATGEHKYVTQVTKATCTEQGYTTYTCSVCGYSYTGDVVAATGHVWDTDADCVEKHCTVCDETQPATASHDYHVTSETAATCEAGGSTVYTCEHCGDHYTVTSLALGHDYETDSEGNIIWTDTGVQVLKDSSTCTYTCKHTAHCTACGKDVEQTYEATIHNYALTVTKEATCSVAGTKEMKCTVCGDVSSTSTTVTYYAEHSYDDGTTSGDCTTYTCKNCDSTKTTYSSTTATVTTSVLSSSAVELSSGAVISMSTEAANTLSTASTLTLSATAVEASSLNNLSEETTSKLDSNAVVYSITLSDGTDNITSFGGTVTVKLPYTLAEGEDESYIVIYYIDDDGDVEAMDAVYSDGYVTFETTHFSYYSVGKYTAEDLCAKYGHNLKVYEKAATCTEAGYHIEVCTRCGKTITNKTIAALGHNFKEEITTPATCTANGVVTYTCTECGATYAGVIVATGHNWQLQNTSEVATCTHSGHNDYCCSECGATYTEFLAQIDHNYKATVTAPTCTEQGYTTYTCTMCGDTYKDNYTDPTGHKYNAEVTEPTCTEQGYTTYTCTMCGDSYTGDYVAATGHHWDSDYDCVDKTCIICGATSPATTSHTYVNGVCSVCGHGCDHTYTAIVTAPTCTQSGYTTYTCTICGNTYKGDTTDPTGHKYETEVVAPTCTEQGYTIYTCTICGNTYKGDTTEPTGHKYGSDNLCIYCGATNPDADTGSVTVSSCGYTITLTDVTLSVTQYDEYEDSTVKMTYELNAAQLYVTIEGNVMTLYGTGSLSYSYSSDDGATEAYTATATIYGDGEYLYIYSAVKGTENQTLLARYDYDYILGNYADMICSTDELMSQLTAMAETYLGTSLYNQWLDILNNNSALADEITSKLFEELFAETATANGYEYTLNVDALAKFNTDLYNLTVSDILDKYIGEGTLASIESFISGIENKTLNDVITDILLYGDDYGITKDIAFATINTLFTAMSGSEFDIEAKLSSTAVEDQELGKMTISAICAKMMNISDYSQINAMLDQIGAMNLYTTLMGSETAKTIYDVINSLVSSNVIAVKLITDQNNVLTSVQFVTDGASVNDFAYMASEIGDSDGTVTATYYTTISVSLNCALDVQFSAEIPDGSDDVKTEVDSLYSDVIDTIKTACANSSTGTVTVNGDTLGVNSDGSIYLIYTYYVSTSDEDSDASQNVYEIVFNISAADMIEIEYDCTDSYWVYIHITTDEGSFSTSFYVNAAKGVVSENHFHNYVQSEAPAGVPTSADEVSCGQYYYAYYTCSDCGYVNRVSYYKSHTTYEVYSLVDENGTCDDGIYVQGICYECSEVVYSYTTSGHMLYTKELFTLTCNSDYYNGTATIYADTCLCGEYCYIYYKSDLGCEFNDISSTEEITDENGNVMYIETYKCCYDGCENYYTHAYYNCSTLGDDVYTYYQYNDDGTYTYYKYIVKTNRHSYSSSSGTYTDSDGYTVEWNGYYCTCGEGYKWIYKYDTNGYQVYYGYEEIDSNGNITNSWHYEYTRDSNGNITQTAYYVGDTYQYTYTYESSYDESTLTYTTTYTYTYSDGSTRVEKTIEQQDVYGRNIYYYHQTINDGEVTYWYSQTYTFSSEDPCYALYTYEDMNGYAEQYCDYYHCYYWLEQDNGTCTQPNIHGSYCIICGEGDTSVNGHSWYYDAETGLYVCSRCGLESENGSSSYIILEDLTANSTYGRDGYVSIGYYCKNADSGDWYISYYLVSADDESTEIVIAPDVENTGTIIYISLETLKAIAESAGVSLESYNLKVSFFYTDGSDVASITITDLTETTTTHTHNYVEASNTYDETDCGEYYNIYYECTGCGVMYYETYLKSHNYATRYSLIYEDGTCYDGVLIEEYCTDCGEATTIGITYSHLYNGYTAQYQIPCNADGMDGVWYIEFYTCPRCDVQFINTYVSGDNACQFSSRTEELIYDQDGTTVIGYVYKYTCENDGCGNYRLEYHYLCSTTYGYTYTEYYQYYSDGTSKLVCTVYESDCNHSTIASTYNEATDEDGNIVRTWGYTCQYCDDYYYETIETSDSNGNVISNEEKKEIKGNIVQWSKRVKTYDESNRLINSYYTLLDSNGNVVYWTEEVYTYEGDSTDPVSYTNSYGYSAS